MHCAGRLFWRFLAEFGSRIVGVCFCLCRVFCRFDLNRFRFHFSFCLCFRLIGIC